MIILAALEADQPEETTAADLVRHLVIDAQDRVLLARIVLDPDLPDVLDLAPVPVKVLLPKKQPKSRFSTLYQNICHAKIKKNGRCVNNRRVPVKKNFPPLFFHM